MTQMTNVAFYTAATWSSLEEAEKRSSGQQRQLATESSTRHGIGQKVSEMMEVEMVVPNRKSYAVQRHHRRW